MSAPSYDPTASFLAGVIAGAVWGSQAIDSLAAIGYAVEIAERGVLELTAPSGAVYLVHVERAPDRGGIE